MQAGRSRPARLGMGAFEVGFASSQAAQALRTGMHGLPDEIPGISGGHRDQRDAFEGFHLSYLGWNSRGAFLTSPPAWKLPPQDLGLIPRLVNQVLQAIPTSALNPCKRRSSRSRWLSYG